MEKKTHEFKAGMVCEGCSGAITRILKKIEGVEEVTCDVPAQQVIVKGTADMQIMLDKLKKWGEASDKMVEYVGEK
ncbi:unnamed protein product [Vitrella brassicaformis CCMP3155]|uniref:HMA domain-containing protein n=1 Tax=Vitrella brassicaformis (strain CCMP3155) TaxID=1169540 RepID=A0A0G4ENM6_VITBC|nr:unnamed protein product [Vitrella brassicaformis CCMP3155]|eukprot:CEL98457.1 unnamed protein product [Vitrella brassicaformis CCMP3155]